MYLLQNHNNTEKVKREEVQPCKPVCHEYITLSNNWTRVKDKYILEVNIYKLFPLPRATKSWMGWRVRCISVLEVNNMTWIDLRWVVKRWKACVDFRPHLISTNVNVSHRKSMPSGGTSWPNEDANQHKLEACVKLATPFGQDQERMI